MMNVTTSDHSLPLKHLHAYRLEVQMACYRQQDEHQ